MRMVDLAGTGQRVPVLGFGCTGLMGPPTERERIAFLETAYDAGVRHFDVARYYGYGEAERVVGGFAKSRRADITITTKFGLNPPARTGGFQLVTGVARKVVRLFPFLRRALTNQSSKLVKSGAFSVEDARQSLETSLRELSTDYIDVWLMHECTVADTQNDELLRFLEDAQRQGKIRRWGLGTGIDNTLAILAAAPAYAPVVQFANSIVRQDLKRLSNQPRCFTITHQALAESFRSVRERLQEKPAVARDWSRQIGADCADPAVVSALMLNYAVQANPDGLVLFGSRDHQRIRQNVASVNDSRYTNEQLTLLARLAAAEFAA